MDVVSNHGQNILKIVWKHRMEVLEYMRDRAASLYERNRDQIMASASVACGLWLMIGLSRFAGSKSQY